MSYIDFSFNLIPYWSTGSSDVSGNGIQLVFDRTKITDVFDYNTDWVINSYLSSIGYCTIKNYSGSSDYIRKKTLDGSANALSERYFNLIINPGIDSSNNFYLSYDNKHYGFIAQDVQKIYPHLTKTKIMGEYLTINYNELIPVMVKQIQNLKKELEDVKKVLSNGK